MVFKSTWRYLPEPILHLFRYLPGREYTRFRHYLDFVRKTAREVVEKSEETGNGKDIISILMRANNSENPKTKLSDVEVVDQVCECHAFVTLIYVIRIYRRVALISPQQRLCCWRATIPPRFLSPGFFGSSRSILSTRSRSAKSSPLPG